MKKYSIVIPTYNHCEDLLKPCIETIIQYSSIENLEIIIVANGCVDGTREYTDSLMTRFDSETIKVIWFDQPMGYTRSTNAGIGAATGQYIVLLNNDVEIIHQDRDRWLDMLEKPFIDNPRVGIVGPLVVERDRYAGHKFVVFFCAMIKREVFNKIGLLDESYSPGGGEDTDFSIRAAQAGFEIADTGDAIPVPGRPMHTGPFPIWHKANKTFGDSADYTLNFLPHGNMINIKKYNKNVKLFFGPDYKNHRDYIAIDNDHHDFNLDFRMDPDKLDFDTGFVSEILSLHYFEYIDPTAARKILTEWNRVLKVGGKLIIELTDTEALIREFLQSPDHARYGIASCMYGIVDKSQFAPRKVNQPYRYGWWPEAIRDLLIEVGFDVRIQPPQFAYPGKIFRIEAFKLEPQQKRVNHDWLRHLEHNVYREIFVDNVYGVTDDEIKNATVFDIGANFGMFSLYCFERGAREITAIEAQPTIYNQMLLKNVEGFSAIKPMLRAVYSEDDKTVYIENQSVDSRIGTTGEPTQTITLKTLTEPYKDNNLVLKMDCEGSEYDILLTSPDEVIQKFKVIYIELHSHENQNPEYRDVNLIRNRLSQLGFVQVICIPMFSWDVVNGERVNYRELGAYNEKWIRS